MSDEKVISPNIKTSLVFAFAETIFGFYNCDIWGKVWNIRSKVFFVRKYVVFAFLGCIVIFFLVLFNF